MQTIASTVRLRSGDVHDRPGIGALREAIRKTRPVAA
jgi:hypothetical protein